MSRWRRTAACERAAQSISLELDDELSELAGAALRRHLDRCEACSAVSEAMAGFTAELRDARVERPEQPVSVAPPRTARARIVQRTAGSFVLGVALSAAIAVFVLPQSMPVESSSVLASATTKERLQFAAAKTAHVESKAFATASAPPPRSPFAARVLS